MTPGVDPAAVAPDAAPPAHAWHLVIGLALWFAGFCALYGGLAVACALAPPAVELGRWNWLNAGVLVLTAAATAAFVAAAWASARTARRLSAGPDATRRRFIAGTAAALYATAALSTAVMALPALLLPPCV